MTATVAPVAGHQASCDACHTVRGRPWRAAIRATEAEANNDAARHDRERHHDRPRPRAVNMADLAAGRVDAENDW